MPCKKVDTVTHHPKKAHVRETMEGKRRQHPGKGRHTFQKREEDKLGDKLGEKLGDKEGKASDTPSNKGTRVRRQWETMGDKGRQDLGHTNQHGQPCDNGRQWETMGDNGRQWETMGDNGRQWETMGDNGRQCEKGRQGETREDKALGRRTRNPTHVVRQWETRGDKTSGRRTHHPTQAHMWGDNGRKAGRQGGEKGRKGLGKADTPS